MPVITVNDQQYALHPGQNRLGAGADADVRVGTDAALGVQAIVDVVESGHPVIRRATTSAAVRVNGVPLVDPTPLMHGDKVEVAGAELYYADDANSGATQFVSASEIAAIAAAGPVKNRATLASGGRLVSLVDGKMYAVPAGGLRIGREAGCDVVIAQTDVSRRHAEVIAVDEGYEIRDFSSNGLLVNGVRIEKSRLLSQSDVIQVGSEEFRFHADGPPLTAWATPAVSYTPTGAPSAVADTRPLLATLHISNTGPTNGQQYEIRVPLAHLGRGAHNDVAINDESISDSHAKIQCRDGRWFVTDLDSTNGSYVGGVRFTGERRLHGIVDLRFGNVKLSFRPTGILIETPKETRAIASVERAKLNNTTSMPAHVAASTPTTPTHSPQGVPAWVWVGVMFAMVAVAVFFLLNR